MTKKPKSGYKLVKSIFGKEIEIPEEWELKNLGDDDVSEIIMGQSPPGSTYNKEQNGLPFFQGKKDFGEKFPKPTVWCNKPKKIAKQGDILISVRAPVGSINWTLDECCIGRGLSAIRVKIEPEYVYYFLKSLQQKLSKSGEGAVFNSVGRDFLNDLKIPVPPLKEQEKIASILSKVDALISSYDASIETTKKLKKGLMQKLLTKGIDHKKFKKVKWLFGKEIQIPEGWEKATIEEVAKITTGTKNTQDKTKNGKYPFYVRSQKIEKIDSFSYDEEAVLTAGDGVGTGKVFHHVNGKFDLHQRAYKISNFGNNLNGHYFYYYFKKNFFNRAMAMNANASVDSIRMDTIAKMLIPLPPLKEQEKIASILSNIDAQIQSQTQYKGELERQKKSLMQKLLTGQVRVKA